MKISILKYQGLVTVFLISLPVYAITLGVIIRCNTVLKSRAMWATADEAERNAALLSSEVLRIERLCATANILRTHHPQLPDTDFVLSYASSLFFHSQPRAHSTLLQGIYVVNEDYTVQGVLWNDDSEGTLLYAKSTTREMVCLYPASKSGAVSYSSPARCMASNSFLRGNAHSSGTNNSNNDCSLLYRSCRNTAQVVSVLNPERFSRERGLPFILANRNTGEEVFRSQALHRSLLSAADDYVQKVFHGCWGNVSGRACFWSSVEGAPVCLVPVDALNSILITQGRRSANALGGVGAATTVLVLVAVSVPVALFWAFTVAVGTAIKRISGDMRDVSALKFGPVPATDSNKSGAWWEPFVPRDIAKVQAGVRGLRLCAMAMASYISPRRAREVITGCCGGSGGGGEGAQRVVAVMFVSLRGHEYLSSTTETDFWRVLSAFYKNFGQVIYSCGGVIDKYINGSIMALFDAPAGPTNRNRKEMDRTKENAMHACEAALLFQDALERTKEELVRHGAADSLARVAGLGYRAGIHCGAAYCGNVGYEARADYTACGNEVNIANRIEAQADVYGVSVLVSGSVADRVCGEFCCALLDTVRLRGQSTGETRLYNLLGDVRSRNSGRKEGAAAEVVVARFGEIHRLIRAGQDSRAVELIWRTLEDREFRSVYKKSLGVLLRGIQTKDSDEPREREVMRRRRRRTRKKEMKMMNNFRTSTTPKGIKAAATAPT